MTARTLLSWPQADQAPAPEPAIEAMHTQLWHVPLAHRPTRSRTTLHQLRVQIDASAAGLYATGEAAERVPLLSGLAHAYRTMATLLPPRAWERRILIGRADLVEAVAATEHRRGQGWNLAPVLDKVAIVPDWDTWTALACTSDHLERAELLGHLYHKAVTSEQSGWIGTVLMALAVTETAVAEHPPTEHPPPRAGG